VGVVITHSDNDDREYHISGKQVAMVAEMAKECAELHGEHGEHFVVVRAAAQGLPLFISIHQGAWWFAHLTSNRCTFVIGL